VVLSSEHDNLEPTEHFLFQPEEFVKLDTSVQGSAELDELETLEEGPVMRSELVNIDPTKFPLLTHLIELAVGSRFPFWLIAEHYIKEYRRQKGFAVNRYQVGYHKDAGSFNQIVKRQTFSCEYAGTYKPKKTKPLDQQRNKGSKKTDCKWHINLSNPEYSSFIHVNFVDLKHNHELLADNTKFATKFRKFDPLVLAEIERTNLSNAIQKIKHENLITGSDVSNLLKFLLNQQKEEPTMFVQLLINVDNVVLYDNTSRTNKYNFPLSLFVIVDNDRKSRLGIEPKVILTDMDAAMELKAKLGKTAFKQFVYDFWKMRNSLCINIFEQRFETLLETYSNINEYLQDSIYLTRHSWAYAFISRIFTAGMQSTQYVESINAIIHKAVSSSSTMFDVAKALDSQIQREALNKDFLLWKYKSMTYYQPFVKQMCESVLYRYEKLSLDEAFKFNEDQSDQWKIYEN
ncbi:3630_t:CDS:2, partial [Scutellospora calospora]